MTHERSPTATPGKSWRRSATARLATVASSIARKAAPDATASTMLDRAWPRRPAMRGAVLSIRTSWGVGERSKERTIVLFSRWSNGRATFSARVTHHLRPRRPPGPRRPPARPDPRDGRQHRVGRGPGGPDDRAAGDRAGDEQERALRALRLQGGAAAGDDRRGPRDLRPRGGGAGPRARARAAAARGADRRQAALRARRDLRRRLLLRDGPR